MKKSIVLIGKESVGKSQLIHSLTGKSTLSEKLKGTTISVQRCETEAFQFIDTPGILLESDSVTSQLALKEIPEKDCVLLVISATSIDQDLDDMLPLVQEKPGAIIVTHWDKMEGRIPVELLEKIEQEVGVPLIKVDARDISVTEKEEIFEILSNPQTFRATSVPTRVKVTLKPPPSLFEIPVLGKLICLFFLFLPAWIAVQFAIFLADSFYDTVFNSLGSLLKVINSFPAPINHLLGMDYGIVAMFPFLVLYALPTVFLFGIILSIYKTSGLIDRLTVSLHQLVVPFGLAGRDIVRVIMGFGCNVPAVISTRACSASTRGNCISAIAFGAACSYQLPATVAVFAAAKMDYLVIPYLLILLTSTSIYLWLITPQETRLLNRNLAISERDFLQWPSLRSIVPEMTGLVKEFLTVAFPIFIVICLIAGLLNWLGAIEALSALLSPFMTLFNLPTEAATSVVLGSIRKDGLAIGLLNPDWTGVKIPITHPVQVLTVVYLAGVLLPCLVTLYSIMREISVRFALKLIARQMVTAFSFSLLIAWTGYLLFDVTL